MDISFSKPTIYISHPIRGTSGDIQGNCKKALACGKRFAKVFPEVNFYIPAAGDLTLQILTHHNKLSVEDVMFADLQLLKACHGWIYLNFQDSKGSEIEWQHTMKLGLTVGKEDWIRDDLSKASFGVIRRRLNDCVERTVENWRRNK